MEITESILTIVIILVVMTGVIIKSYRSGHKGSYLLLQIVLGWIIYKVLLYSIYPIVLKSMGGPEFTFKEQFISGTLSDVRENLINYLKICGIFAALPFFSMLLFPVMRKNKVAIITLIIICIINVTNVILTNYIHGVMEKWIYWPDYITMLLGYMIGYVLFQLVYRINPKMVQHIGEKDRARLHHNSAGEW